MYFVGTKSVYVLLCPLPGSVHYRLFRPKDLGIRALWYNLLKEKLLTICNENIVGCKWSSPRG